VSKSIVIVGGGMAGLAASIYLARAGKTVTIFERRRFLGGRAVTHLRHGYRFNLGPHAVYRAGAGSTVYRELGIPVLGGVAKTKPVGFYGSKRSVLPAGLLSLLTTRHLGPGGKAEAAAFFLRLGRLDPKRFESMTVREWLDTNIGDAKFRDIVQTFIRVATYAASEEQSAAAALEQLKLVRRGVIYVDEGWQKIVDSLHSNAVTAGVNFVSSAHVVRVDHDGAVRGIELGELELDERNDTISLALPDVTAMGERGTRIPADRVLLAIEPEAVSALVGDGLPLPDFEPVTAATLDVALSRLPQPKKTLAFGVDRPLYFSVHSRWAQLTPRGGALLHSAKYRKPGTDVSEAELESLVDEMQPGWRDVVVHRRYLPSMTVSNALVKPGMLRPDVRTPIRGLYLAGDWVGSQGLLSDAALASARDAAKAILADD
jgi:phytoene dehydrogenase-like protein